MGRTWGFAIFGFGMGDLARIGKLLAVSLMVKGQGKAYSRFSTQMRA
jgi:hypothetical protein